MNPEQYRKHREQLGLTQSGLASLLGVTRETVNRRESGTQRITEEAAIALLSLTKKRARRRQQNNQVTDAEPQAQANSRAQGPRSV